MANEIKKIKPTNVSSEVSDTESTTDFACDDANFFKDFSLDEKFIKAVKLTDSIINKLYNKPTAKEKVFPAVFVIDNNQIKSLYDKIEYKLKLHDIRDIEFTISVLGTDKDKNIQNTDFKSIEEFLKTNDTKQVVTKLVVLNWKTKLFLNNTNNPISELIGEEFNIEVSFSSAPSDTPDEAYFMFNDYPIKSKGIIHVTVVHSNQVIADELIQHVSDFVSEIEDHKVKKNSIIYNNKRIIAQCSEKILGITAVIPLSFLFFNIHKCLDNVTNIVKLISLCLFFLIINLTFANSIGQKIFDLLNRRKSTSWLLTNEYTKREYEKYKSTFNPVIKAFFWFCLPIILNVLSTFISSKIGIN